MDMSLGWKKEYIRKKVIAKNEPKLVEENENKTKFQFYKKWKKSIKMGERATYMNKLTRKECHTIFAARSRMLKVRGNHTTGSKELTCRKCELCIETQEHVLQDCIELVKDPGETITPEMFFTENIEDFKAVASIIAHRINTVNENPLRSKGK